MSAPITDWDVLQMMERFGGGFAQALAVACHRADPVNLAKIKATFPELWAQYAEMVPLVKERDRERDNAPAR